MSHSSRRTPTIPTAISGNHHVPDQYNKYPPAKPGVFHMRTKPYVTSKRVPSRKYDLTAAKVLLLAARKRAQKFPIVICSPALSSSNWCWMYSAIFFAFFPAVST